MLNIHVHLSKMIFLFFDNRLHGYKYNLVQEFIIEHICELFKYKSHMHLYTFNFTRLHEHA